MSELTRKLEEQKFFGYGPMDCAKQLLCDLRKLSHALDAEREAREKLEQRVDVLYATATKPSVYDPATCRAIAQFIGRVSSTYVARDVESFAGKPLPAEYDSAVKENA